MNDWLLLTFAIIAEVCGTSALKLSEGFTKLLPSFVVLLGYGFSFWALSIIIKSLPVGVVYAVWSGAGIALIALVGWLFFDQRLSLMTLLGIVLIIMGILIINLSGKMH